MMDSGTSGTVLRCILTLKTRHPLTLQRLRAYARESIEKLGLGFRRFAVEKYQGVKGAYTVIAFLNESHLELTAYPEDNRLEVEVASCKKVPLQSYLDWNVSLPNLIILATCVLRKDFLGRWNKEGWNKRC